MLTTCLLSDQQIAEAHLYSLVSQSAPPVPAYGLKYDINLNY